MRKYFVFITLLFGFTSMCAQHISFMGIQLGQSEKNIESQLLKKGFQYVGRNNVMYTKMYEGKFWKFENTRLNTIVEDGKVTAISLCPSPRIYNQIPDYTNLVFSLDKKYGKHHVVSRSSKSPELAVNQDFFWIVAGGAIVTNYAQNEITGDIIICINYYDKTNSQMILGAGRNRDTDNDL